MSCNLRDNELRYRQSEEVFDMKDSTVSACVENNVKIEAEDILQKLGVPVSVVINPLYRNVWCRT